MAAFGGEGEEKLGHSPISVNLSQNVPEQEKRRAEASVLW
jgi:hypothetical protein